VAYPGQDRLAALTGYDVRSVRSFTHVIEAADLVVLKREQRPDGSERIFYKPGAALRAAVEDFEGRFPDDHAKPPHALPRAPTKSLGLLKATQLALPEARVRIAQLDSGRRTHAHPPERVSGGPPEMVSGELSDLKDLKEPSSCAKARALTDSNEQEVMEISEIDIDVARIALAEHRQRRFPGRPTTLLDAGNVAIVAKCSSAIAGDRHIKIRAMQDALDHAFKASKGHPTVRYIWEKLDHFLEHESRGRRIRQERERARERASQREAEERRKDREWQEQRRDAYVPPPEFTNLFRQGAPTRRTPVGGSLSDGEIARRKAEQLVRLRASDLGTTMGARDELLHNEMDCCRMRTGLSPYWPSTRPRRP
jgi:hypothetical protein